VTPPITNPVTTQGGSAPPFSGRVIRYTEPNMTGDDVRTWQQQMRSRGWTIDVDGFYGPGSVEVCRKFQAEKSLDVDGAVGPGTWRATWESTVT
jgi:peptidoglycan hydrolase-like protein with peptidoglycan-binding domain